MYQLTNLFSAAYITGDAIQHQVQLRSVADLVIIKLQSSCIRPFPRGLRLRDPISLVEGHTLMG